MEVKGEESNVHEVRKHHHILELTCQPDQVERILVDADLLSQGRGVIRAQPRTAIWIYANAKVAHTGLEARITRDALNLGVDGIVDLRGIWVRCVVVVIEREEEDVRY